LNWRTIKTLLLVGVVAFFAFFLLFYGNSENGTPDDEASDFVIKMADYPEIGDTVFSTEEITQRPTLIVGWTTGCGACVEQIEYYKEHYDEISEQINILAVNLITSEESEEKVENFVDQANLPFPVVADHGNKLVDNFPFRFIPANFLFDADGRVIESREGKVDLETLQKWLDSV